MSTNKLSSEELKEIAEKLPPQFAALKELYPITIAAVARDWDKPPYPEGYLPKSVEVYYNEEARGPALCIDNNQLTYVELEEPVTDPNLVILDIDDDTAYVQIQGRVILNRIGGAVLPDVAVNPETWLRSVINNLPVK